MLTDLVAALAAARVLGAPRVTGAWWMSAWRVDAVGVRRCFVLVRAG